MLPKLMHIFRTALEYVSKALVSLCRSLLSKPVLMLEDTHRTPAPILIGDYVDPHADSLRPLVVAPHKTHVHALISGTTRMGKSRAGVGLILQKLDRGEQVIVLDPHGSMFHLAQQYLVASGAFDDPAMKERVLFYDLPDAANRELYPALDVLNRGVPLHIAALNMLDTFHRIWPELDVNSSSFDTSVLCVCALLMYHNLPITLFPHVLTDRNVRTQLFAGIEGDETLVFFQNHIKRLEGERQLHSQFNSSLKRALLLLFSPELRYPLMNNSTPNLARFDDILASGKSVFINLHFPTISTTQLYGALLLVLIEQAVLLRLGAPEDKRPPCTLFVDEASLFVAKSEIGLNTFLQRTAGAGFSVWLCHQNIKQFPESTQNALDNCALRMVFHTTDDAKYHAPYLYQVDPLLVKDVLPSHGPGAPRVTFYTPDEQRTQHENVFKSLGKRQAVVKLPDDDQAYRIYTPELPDPEKEELAGLDALKDYYLSTLFHSTSEITRARDKRLERLGIVIIPKGQQGQNNAGKPPTSEKKVKDTQQASAPTESLSAQHEPEPGATIKADDTATPPIVAPPAQTTSEDDDDEENALWVFDDE